MWNNEVRVELNKEGNVARGNVRTVVPLERWFVNWRNDFPSPWRTSNEIHRGFNST